MASPLFRVTLITLLACGGAGALLFYIQAPAARSVSSSSDDHHASQAHPLRRHSPDHDVSPFELALAAAIQNRASAAASRPALSQSTSSLADQDDDSSVPLPVARLALGYVGTDELADAIWEQAINDPAISNEDRKDLIEDLNEDGFPDPKNLTHEDLPLIEARLALIERLAPSAMDDTNAAAFAESRKDLLDMRRRLTDPVTAPAPPPAPGQVSARK
jgi:hypothetical protein